MIDFFCQSILWKEFFSYFFQFGAFTLEVNSEQILFLNNIIGCFRSIICYILMRSHNRESSISILAKESRELSFWFFPQKTLHCVKEARRWSKSSCDKTMRQLFFSVFSFWMKSDFFCQVFWWHCCMNKLLLIFLTFLSIDFILGAITSGNNQLTQHFSQRNANF